MSAPDAGITKGYRVVVPAPTAKGKPKPISRMFTVRSAADEFAELARRAGHPDATVQTMHVVDGARF
jgi:hypothetical protein